MCEIAFIRLSNTFDGQRYQFKDINVSVQRGAKVGLVGVNGCGKSTLLKAIGGREKVEGTIELKSGLKVVYVDQEPEFDSGARRPLHGI
jgi:ATP-binding cassette subfamily F protein uup